MNGSTPHLVQYQGSKRLLAPKILPYLPKKMNRLIEPFSGMAAISISAACEQRADKYLINDINSPLINLLQSVIENPTDLIEKYNIIWNEQFFYSDGHLQHYYMVREKFNLGERNPENMLYLLARCVKGAVRYSSDGRFNQSPDKRRHGTTPNNISKNARAISTLLKGKISFSSLDYRELFNHVKKGDVVYMDPPYQGVSDVKDCRYFSGVNFSEFINSLEQLNQRGVDFLVSYDGECGGKAYGEDLPASLECKKILLNAGLSSQSVLLGRQHTTYEALYVSRGLIDNYTQGNDQLSLFEELA